jgi:LmbE family N-acetylglucosaminyl deacetylase
MITPQKNPGLLVAVAAHADDAELNAGGLMAKWVAHGGRVALVMVTNNCSGEILPASGDETCLERRLPAATTALRHREQATASALLGAKVYHLGWPQRHYWNGRKVVSLDHGTRSKPPPGVEKTPLVIAFRQPPAIKRMGDLLVALKPARVITQIPTDLDTEHHATACLVWQAFAANPKKLGRVPLQFWSPGSSCIGGIFDPGYDVIEDISDHFEAKLRLCAAHRSQMVHMRWEMVVARARKWGRRIGVRYAEPFKTAQKPSLP